MLVNAQRLRFIDNDSSAQFPGGFWTHGIFARENRLQKDLSRDRVGLSGVAREIGHEVVKLGGWRYKGRSPVGGRIFYKSGGVRERIEGITSLDFGTSHHRLIARIRQQVVHLLLGQQKGIVVLACTAENRI